MDIFIKDKIKVFLSSICCVEKYDIVRKKIKKKIEQTNFADVFTFEGALASTQKVNQFYLREVDKSDVCIFLIDNLDGISPGVLKEIQRAKIKEKKSIFIFNTENKKDPTEIEKELIKIESFKFVHIDSFKEFLTIGVNSLIDDIARIYRNYCYGFLHDNEFDEESKQIKINKMQVGGFAKKQSVANLDKVKTHLSNYLYEQDKKIENTDSFDDVCLDFLQVYFGEKNIHCFNLNTLFIELENLLEPNIYTVVKLRWNAIMNYYKGSLTIALDLLDSAYSEAKKNEIPKWLINDILIDRRTVYNYIKTSKNEYPDYKIQKEIDESEEYVVYPYIDRLLTNYYEAISKEEFDLKNISAFSVRTTSIINKLDDISEIFALAIINGSLTHISLIYRYLEKMALHLADNYNDLNFKIATIKLSLLNGDNSRLKKIINANSVILGELNSNDCSEIYICLNSIPIIYKRKIAKLNAYEYFGYYLSDNDYKDISLEISEIVSEFLNSENRIIELGNHVFKALDGNARRFNSNKLLMICNVTLEKKFTRWFEDVIKIVYKMNLNDIPKDLLDKFLDNVLSILIDDNPKNYSHNRELKNILIILIENNLCSHKLFAKFEELASSRLKYFYEQDYLYIKDENYSEKIDLYIETEIKSILNENKTQGANGVFFRSAIDHFYKIKNIIKYKKYNIDYNMGQKIISTCIDTLVNSRQELRIKIDAIQLIIFIKYLNTDIKFSYDLLIEHLSKEPLNFGNSMDFFEYTTTNAIEFDATILKLVLGLGNENDLLNTITAINYNDNSDIISAIKSIENLLNTSYIKQANIEVLNMFMQFILFYSNSDNREIRYQSIRTLTEMINEKTSERIFKRFSQIMDKDTPRIKFLILNCCNIIKKFNEEIYELILMKANVDNNYVIRKRAKEII